MILIIGGAWQGKLEFAKRLAAEKRPGLAMTDFKPLVAEGSQDDFEAASNRSVVHGLHEYVRRLLEEQRSIEDFVAGLKAANPEVIVTTNELGCGIVPMDPEERRWREAAGRAALQAAKESDQVYRMVCGIAARIK